MQWILDNWIWFALGGGFIAMHLFGHGSHGGHGGSGKSAQTADDAKAEPGKPRPASKTDNLGEHS